MPPAAVVGHGGGGAEIMTKKKTTEKYQSSALPGENARAEPYRRVTPRRTGVPDDDRDRTARARAQDNNRIPGYPAAYIHVVFISFIFVARRLIGP